MTVENLLSALEGIYRASLPRFLRVATAITGDSERGSDAVHDAFVSCLRAAPAFRGEGPLEGWVWRSVVNSALRVRRDQRPAVDGDARDDHSGNGQESGDFGEVRAALAALSERQRVVLFLRYYADLDYRAIADALGISIGTVGAALNKAHAALRASMAKEAAE